MSKRRKYDIRNKKSFMVILLLSILIVCIFSLFIYKYSKASKIEYVIEAGSVLQDVNKNYLTTSDDAKLKMRWDDSYYLVYNDEKINLGKKVIVYNTITGGMKLYGTFYEINSSGKIIENKRETVLPNTTDSKFYKIADREYLLVDRKITSSDNAVDASNYLLVELDKSGNAKLSNDKIQLKTISPMKLLTSKYSFDIANELLSFGKYTIDLKKIIGTTNEYVPDDEDTDGSENDKPNDGKVEGDNQTKPDNSGEFGLGEGIGTGGNQGDIINNNDMGELPSLSDLLDKVKMTSIIRVVEGITQIDIDYVIYDPYNEYKSVYAEVVVGTEQKIIYMSKTDTHMTIDNLRADSEYKINFVYTTVKKNEQTGEEEIVPHTFEHFDLRTKRPEYTISVYKISKVYNTLTYKVNLQSDYSISKVNVNLSFDYHLIDPETGLTTKKTASIDSSVSVDANSGSSVLGTLDISGYEIDVDTLLKLTVKSVEAAGYTQPIQATYTFRFGR